MIKHLCLSLVLTLAPMLAKAEDENRALVAGIREVLPKKGWSLRDTGSEIVILGPKVKTLYMVSLPMGSDTNLWRDYARTERVEVTIHFQARILRKDIAELREIQARLASILEPGDREINHKRKDQDEHIRDFGFVRLPDYWSDRTSVFVQDNVGGRFPMEGWPISVKPRKVYDIVNAIYRILEKEYQVVDQASFENEKEANLK
jgi:hypothetical protein